MGSIQQTLDDEFDVVVVGAGIAGINAAYRLQTELPGCRYTILEARGEIGGTWNFFRYPGLRSDSDLHTYGFQWRPWIKDNPIADGASITKYMKESASIHGIDRHIQFLHDLSSAGWSSKKKSWTLTVQSGDETKYIGAQFLILGTGYFDYKEALPAIIPGIENFKGTLIHPQFWPADLDYNNKRMVVVGSGATAITLIPSLADKASHITMLQRSPSYIMSMSNGKNWIEKLMPGWLSRKLARLRFLIIPFLLFRFCRAYPSTARRLIRSATIEQIPKTIPHDPHFEPEYNPWEQRLCLCPDGDFFKCLREGKASIATGRIKTVTEAGISLESGETLDADIIVTATGLKLQLGGGARIFVDGQQINIAEKFLWRGVMLQDVPNCALVIGYTNASWTLGADTTAMLVCRLLKYLTRHRMRSAVPKLGRSTILRSLPTLNLSSTYIQAAPGAFPKSGDQGPWKPRENYFRDYFNAAYGDIESGLQFS